MHPIQLLLLLIPLVSGQSTMKPDPPTMELFGIPYKLWRCGNERVLNEQIIGSINRSCPLAAAEFNHCCAVHDDCYDTQRGRDKCDNNFCDCLAYYVANDQDAATCKYQTQFACDIVRQQGEDAYNKSANVDGAPKEEEYLRLPEEIPQIQKEFEKMFEKCDEQHATISSCALNYDLCYRNPSSKVPHEGCLVNLIRCLDDTRNDRDPSHECDAAIELVLYKMVEKDEKAEKEPEKAVETEQKQQEEASNNGDVNTLVVQEIVQNQTFVQKVYLQVVRRASNYHWIVWAFLIFAIFLCCSISIIGIAQFNQEEPCERRHNDQINFHVTTQSATSSKDTETSEVSRGKRSSRSSKKSPV